MSAGSDRAIQRVPNRNSVEFATNARAIGGFVRWMTRDIDSQRTDRPARVPLSGAQAAALLRIGGEPVRETERADGGTSGAIVGVAAPRTVATQASAGRAMGRITLAVLGLAGFSVLVQVNSEQVPPNAPQSSGLVGRAPDTGASHLHDTLQGHHKMLNKITSVTAAAVVGIAATVAGAQSAAVQWKVEDGGNGHWYQRVTRESRSWSTLREFAERDGGHLATLTSLPETNFLVNTVLSGNFCFIGGFQLSTGSEPASDWQWVTGEAVRWTNWAVGEPNNYEPSVDEDVMAIWGDGLWADVNEEAYLTNCQHAIVEWSADCNNDNIIDYSQCHNGTLPDYNGNNIPDCCERGGACVVGNYSVQWRPEDRGNGHWYLWKPWESFTSWSASRAAAELVGGYLATLHSAQEASRILALMKGGSCASLAGSAIYLGGYQPANSEEPLDGWRWVTGEPWTYSDWLPNEPNDCCGGEDILGIMGTGGWNDGGEVAPCNASFVFEWSADCNSDGMVDYGQILQGQLADSNTNGVPDICEQPQCQDADITNNQIIDGADIGALLAFWGPVNPVLPQADVNRDGQVNGADLGILLSYWGPCP